MRHSVFGRKISRTKNERRRLFRSLVRELILHGRITTTLAKAKSVQPLIEQLVTKAKKGTDQKRREVRSVLGDPWSVTKLFDDASTRFASRGSGFTRIVKLGTRTGDGAQYVLLSFVDEEVKPMVVKTGEAHPLERKKKSERTPPAR